MKQTQNGRGYARKTMSFMLVPVLALPLMAASLLAAVPRAMADLTVSSIVDVMRLRASRNQSATESRRNVTVYSRGKQARADIDGGMTTIIDSDTVYELDPQAKTYYKLSLKSWSGVPEPLLTRAVAADPTAELDVTSQCELDKTDNTASNLQTLDGLEAKQYLVSGWINVSTRTPDAPPQDAGGRQPGNGGEMPPVPGGADPGGDESSGGFDPRIGGQDAFPHNADTANLFRLVQDDGSAPNGGSEQDTGPETLRSTTLDGQVWLAKSVDFVDDKSNSAWAPALVSSWGVGKLTNSLATQFMKEHGLPLSAKISFSWTDHGTAAEMSPPAADMELGQQISVQTTVAVTSISENPVDPALFTVPPTYTQVAAPAPSAPVVTPSVRRNGPTGGSDQMQ